MKSKSSRLELGARICGVVAVCLGMLAMLLGNYFGGTPPLPISEAYGYAIGMTLLAIGALAVGFATGLGWRKGGE